jgi:hypothetical protein
LVAAIVLLLASVSAVAYAVTSSDEPVGHPPTDAELPSCVPVGAMTGPGGRVGCVLKSDRDRDPQDVYDHESGTVVGYFGRDTMQYVPKAVADRYGLEAVKRCHQANYETVALSPLCVELLVAEGWSADVLPIGKRLHQRP